MARLIVDVSSNNGVPDFHTLKRHGVIGVYIKATEGSSYVNPLLHTQWAAASRAGLRCGVYHFARQDIHPGLHANAAQERLPLGEGVMGVGQKLDALAVLEAEVDPHLSLVGAQGEARHFVNTMRTLPGHAHEAMHAGDLRPVLDFEVGTANHLYSPWRDAFQRAVYGLSKRRTILYTYTGFNNWAPAAKGFGQFWLANYSSHPYLPGGYRSWDLWQFTDAANLGGIHIDASRFPRRPFPLRRITCKGRGT
jgi:GH25 family lysozyme M1 (1,4-beta-N-acetylmuramidase)